MLSCKSIVSLQNIFTLRYDYFLYYKFEYVLLTVVAKACVVNRILQSCKLYCQFLMYISEGMWLDLKSLSCLQK